MEGDVTGRVFGWHLVVCCVLVLVVFW